jgi:alkylresorcinol/alkylpyrone synthase
MHSRLLALATAVPPFTLDQKDVTERIKILFNGNPEILRLLPVFGNAGIRHRYSCVPLEWFEQPHGWKERNRIYIESALPLLEQLTLKLLESSGLRRDEIDAVVTVSTTGIATPSLDALVIERLGLRRDVRRLPIFGLGCAGGVIGLARASELARAEPGSRVLLLVVELCSLNFRKQDFSKSNIVASALFGDGAAGALLSTDGNGTALGASGEYTWPNALDVMGWTVEDDGMQALFAQSIPGLVQRDMRAITDRFLGAHDYTRRDIDAYACHPGGAKVLTALEDAFEVDDDALNDSRATLQDYGNMSAATVLFVLARMDWRNPQRRTLMTTMGPGFTAAFQLLGKP